MIEIKKSMDIIKVPLSVFCTLNDLSIVVENIPTGFSAKLKHPFLKVEFKNNPNDGILQCTYGFAGSAITSLNCLVTNIKNKTMVIGAFSDTRKEIKVPAKLFNDFKIKDLNAEAF